jgi:hypothetical protein
MKIHQVVLVVGALALILAFTSCQSVFASSLPPIQTWEGAQHPAAETAVFTYKGTGAYGLLLYAVDGQPRTKHGDNRLLEGSYSNTLMCGFDLTLLPGEHVFEFYTVDTNPLQIFTIKFPVAAGKTYILSGSSKEFALRADGAAVPFVREEVPSIVEPAETEPHATLEIKREGGAMDVNCFILRIDGKIRSPMYKRHPRWVVMNYSGLASGIVNSIGGTGMLIQGNVEAKEGYLLLRLSPGTHRIEYFAESIFLGQRELGDAVRILDFNFEAGKDYKSVLTPDSSKIEGITEHGMTIAPK